MAAWEVGCTGRNPAELSESERESPGAGFESESEGPKREGRESESEPVSRVGIK
jgi:hypothetical protein